MKRRTGGGACSRSFRPSIRSTRRPRRSSSSLRSVLFALLALAGPLGAGCASGREDVPPAAERGWFDDDRDDLERALAARRAGDVLTAGAILAALAERDAFPRTTHYALGGVLRKRGDAPGALREFRAALAADPTNDRACWNAAALLRSLEGEAAALPYLRRYLYLSPDGPRAPAALEALRADRRRRAGEPPRAPGASAVYGEGNEQAERAEALPEGKDGLQAELYRLRLQEPPPAREGRTEEAPEAEVRDAAAETWKPAPRVGRGLDAYLRGAYAEAEAAFAEAAGRGEDRAHALYLRGLALAKLDRREEALAELARAADLAPQSVLYAHALARGLAAAKRPEEAAARMRAILELDPGFEPARRFLLAAEPPEDADDE